MTITKATQVTFDLRFEADKAKEFWITHPQWRRWYVTPDIVAFSIKRSVAPQENPDLDTPIGLSDDYEITQTIVTVIDD